MGLVPGEKNSNTTNLNCFPAGMFWKRKPCMQNKPSWNQMKAPPCFYRLKLRLNCKAKPALAWVPLEDVNENFRGAQRWPASAPITKPSTGTLFAHLRAKKKVASRRGDYSTFFRQLPLKSVEFLRWKTKMKSKSIVWVAGLRSGFFHLTHTHTYTHLKKTSTTQCLDCKLYIYISL